MVKILLVKMSSLGDIIHTFPALTDAAEKIPHLQIDWVVEEAFEDMPKWHFAVNRVIPIAWRRWRKHLTASFQTGEMIAFLKALRTSFYDHIIDAQGLLKSAVVAKLAHGCTRNGYDAHSARETLASYFYQNRYAIDPYQPVTQAIRTLFAKSLNYPIPSSRPDFGLKMPELQNFPEALLHHPEKFWVFLHGTSHINKEWPLLEWIQLARRSVDEGYRIYLPWGNEEEHKRARCIADSYHHIEVLPRLTINQMARVLSLSSGVVGLDTGFSHLAAALNVPTLTLFRASNAKRVGISGNRQQCVEVLHDRACENATTLKRGIYAACDCVNNIRADQIFLKIKTLSEGYKSIFKKK